MYELKYIDLGSSSNFFLTCFPINIPKATTSVDDKLHWKRDLITTLIHQQVCWSAGPGPRTILVSPEKQLSTLSCQYWPQCMGSQHQPVIPITLCFQLVTHEQPYYKRRSRSFKIKDTIYCFWILFSSSYFAWSLVLKLWEQRSCNCHSNHKHPFPVTSFL